MNQGRESRMVIPADIKPMIQKTTTIKILSGGGDLGVVSINPSLSWVHNSQSFSLDILLLFLMM